MFYALTATLPFGCKFPPAHAGFGIHPGVFPPVAEVLIKNYFYRFTIQLCVSFAVASFKNDIGAGGGTQGLGKDIEVVSTESIIFFFFYYGEERSQANMEGR